MGNTTELTPEQSMFTPIFLASYYKTAGFSVWTTCPYYGRDGLFNPDGRLVDDIGAFQNLADAVLYNSLAWAFAGRPTALFAVNVGGSSQSIFPLSNTTWSLNIEKN